MNLAKYKTLSIPLKSRWGLGIIISLVYIPLFLFSIYFSGIQAEKGIEVRLPFYPEDSSHYGRIADGLLNFGTFTMSEAEPLHLETFRVPMYPLFLAKAKLLFGSYFAAVLLQIMLIIFIANLIVSLGKKMFADERIAYGAAYLFALEPAVIFHSVTLFSETLFTFFIVLAVYLAVSMNANWKRSAGIGVLLALAVLTRPVAMYLLPLAALYELFRNRSIGWKKAIGYAILLIAVFMLVLFPWMYRNHKVAGVFGVSQISAYNLVFYNVPMFEYITYGGTQTGRQMELAEESGVPFEEWMDIRHSKALTEVAVSHLLVQPFSYGVFHAVKSIPFFVGSSIDTVKNSSYNIFGNKPQYDSFQVSALDRIFAFDIAGTFRALMQKPFVLVERLAWVIVWLMVAMSIFLNRAQRMSVLLCAVIIAYFAAVTGPVAYPRYRIPVLPFVFLLFCNGVKICYRSDYYMNAKQKLKSLIKKVLPNSFSSYSNPYTFLSKYQFTDIVDVGANIGQFAQEIRQVFPLTSLHSFEPIKENYSKLVEVFKNDGHFTAYNMAVGDKKESKEMNVNVYSPSSSLLHTTKLHDESFAHTGESGTKEVVTIDTLDSVAREKKLGKNILLKIDVQGYEEQVIKGGLQIIKENVGAMLVEMSFVELYEGQADFEKLHAMLSELGFIYRGPVSIKKGKGGEPLFEDAVYINKRIV